MTTEESQVDESTTTADTSVEVDQNDSGTKLSYEQLEAELARTRKEAASRRVSNKEKDAETARKLAEHDEWKRSQLSEVDRLKAEKAEIEAEMAIVRSERTRDAAAKKAGLTDEDLIPLIKGGTEAEMLAHAKVLATKQKASSASSSDMRAGTRGKPVGGDADRSADQILRNMLAGR